MGDFCVYKVIISTISDKFIPEKINFINGYNDTK